MAFDYEGARKAGYSDAEIADHLAQQNGFDVAGARKSGYSDSELIKHLTATPATPATPAAPEPTVMDKLGRSFKLAGRSLLEGGEAAITYPVRALAEAAAGGMNLAGYKDAADYTHRTLGMGGNGATAALDYAGAPKPETKVEKTFAGAEKMLGGLAAGGGLSRLVQGAPQAAQSVVSNLIPSASTGGEMATAAAIGGGLEAAPEATLGTLGVLGAIKGGKMAAGAVGDYRNNRAADKFIKNYGDKASQAAEITKDFKSVAANPILRDVDEETGVIGAYLRNQEAGTYTKDVKSALKRVDPELLKKYDVETILSSKDVVTPEKLALIRSEENGGILADAIEKSQLAKAMTKPSAASGSIPAIAARGVITGLPAAIGGMAGGLFGPVGSAWVGTAAGSTLAPVASKFAQRLTGKASIPEVIQKMASDKQQRIADTVLSRLGPSQASQGSGALADAARKAEAATAAQPALDAATQAAEAAALKEANIAGMRINRAPAGGAFQALKEHTGLSDEQLVDSMRSLSNHPVLGKYVDQIRKGGNTDDGALYAVQNAINGLQKRSGGILNETTAPGVLYKGSNVSVGSPDISKMIYNMPDDQVTSLLGRDTDTLGKGIESAKAYLNTRATRAMDTFTNGGSIPEADKALLKSMGLI